MVNMLIVAAATLVFTGLAVVGARAQADPQRALVRARAEPDETERATELKRWNARGGCNPRLVIPYAEHANGQYYVTGHGIDNEWVDGLMAADDRLRRWNGKRPRGGAMSRRLD